MRAAAAVLLALGLPVALLLAVAVSVPGKVAALGLQDTIRARLGEQVAAKLKQQEEEGETPTDGLTGVVGTDSPTVEAPAPTTPAPTSAVMECSRSNPCPVPFRCIITDTRTHTGFCKPVQMS